MLHPREDVRVTKAKTIRRLICALCGAAIGSGGLCTFQCAQDGVHEDARPEGSVVQATYVLSEEKPYVSPRRAAWRPDGREVTQ